MRATEVLAMTIDEASAKVRTGPPLDEEEDYALETWAGVLPLERSIGVPQPDPLLRAGIGVPEHVRGYRRPGTP
jgi:hypothetical protein